MTVWVLFRPQIRLSLILSFNANSSHRSQQANGVTPLLLESELSFLRHRVQHTVIAQNADGRPLRRTVR